MEDNFIDLEKNDFGFSTYGEEDIDQFVDDKSYERADKMLELITPLLEQLMKDADKNPNIHWPNRQEVLGKMLKKLKDLAHN